MVRVQMVGLLFSLLVWQVGCGGAPGLQPVTGKVTFPDGQIPQGEVAVVRFEPIEGTQAEGQSKAGSGNIQPDGTFKLMTIQKDDGAFVGEYKVCFTFLKTYVGRESQVDAKYTTQKTTPHTAKVTQGGKNHFEFEVTKPGS